jgi:hypothetical protein
MAKEDALALLGFEVREERRCPGVRLLINKGKPFRGA